MVVPKDKADLLQGTLDMLVLKTLQVEAMHGWGITERLEQWSEHILQLGQGTLYPALYGSTARPGQVVLESHENNRRARYYALTAAGRRHFDTELTHWHRLSRAVNWFCRRRAPEEAVMFEFTRRIATLFRRAEVESGLNEEIRFHIEQQTAKNIRDGMSPEAARRAALRAFGGVEQVKEATRDEFRAGLLEDFVRDLRYGARVLVRAPGFAVMSDPHAGPRHRRGDGRVQRGRRCAA